MRSSSSSRTPSSGCSTKQQRRRSAFSRSHWQPDRHPEEGDQMARDALFPDGLVRPKAPYSPVVRSGDHVYTAGQVGFDPSGTLVAGGIAEQTRQTLANLEACLARRRLHARRRRQGERLPRRPGRLRRIQRGLPRRLRGAVSRRGRRCRPDCPAGSVSRSRRLRTSPAPPRDRGRHAGPRRRRRSAAIATSRAGRRTATPSGSRTARTSRRTSPSRSRAGRWPSARAASPARSSARRR